MVNKNYYTEKFQDKLRQRGKAIDRLIAGIYEFVRENEELLAELKKIQDILKEEEKKAVVETTETNNPKIEKKGKTGKVVASETGGK